MVTIGTVQVSAVVIWLVLFALFLICELATMGLTTVWFAGGSLGGMVVAICGGDIPLQIVVAIVVSIVLLVALRPFARRYLDKGRVMTNVDSLIGQVAKFTKEIDNLNNQGQVVIKGMEWTARSVEDKVIEVGTMVTVEEISGVKVIVRAN